MKYIIGIDFGTTKTLVAHWDGRSSLPNILPLGRSKPAIPTTLHIDKEWKFSFGDDADDLASVDPLGYFCDLKRSVGRNETVYLQRKHFSILELISQYLRHIKHLVETECLHGQEGHVVLTVPAKFGPAQKQALKKVAEDVFGSVELLDEPVAAGLAFLHEKQSHDLGNEVLVFDWGGGTLDIAYLEKLGNSLKLNEELLGGLADLGGEDLDELILENFNEYLVSDGKNSVGRRQHETFSVLRRVLVDGKEMLSRRENHDFRMRGLDCEFHRSLSRSELEQILQEPLERAMKALEETLKKAKSSGLNIKRVLLIGGTSQIPYIERTIVERFGLEAIKWKRHLDAVALGAAIRANQREEVQINPSDVAYEQAKTAWLAGRFRQYGAHLAVAASLGHLAAKVDYAILSQTPDSESLMGIPYQPLLHEKIKQAELDQLELLAENGNVDAMLALSEFYGSTKKPDSARVWAKRAAESNSPFALVLYASLLLDGTLLLDAPAVYTRQQIHELLLQALNQGACIAYLELWRLFSEGGQSNSGDTRALDFLEQGVGHEVPICQYILGTLILSGELSQGLGRRSFEDGIELLRKCSSEIPMASVVIEQCLQSR